MEDVPPCDVVCSTLVTIGNAISNQYKNAVDSYGYATNFQERWEDIQGIYQAAVIGSEEVPSWVSQGVGFAAKEGASLFNRVNALDRSTKIKAVCLVISVSILLYKAFLSKKTESILPPQRRSNRRPGEAMALLKKVQQRDLLKAAYPLNFIRD
jgi:hypothetical protein